MLFISTTAVLILVAFGHFCKCEDLVHKEHPAVIEAGDIMLGGLFPIHEKGAGIEPCGKRISDTGFQRLVAMMFAVDRINADPRFLPGIKIGIHAHDTCQNDIYAMERVLEFIAMRSQSLRDYLGVDDAATRLRNLSHNLPNGDPRWSDSPTGSRVSMSYSGRITKSYPVASVQKPILAVIGPALSSITTAVASVLRLFKIPQISYAATTTELSNRARFDYFFRVVPPDNLQAEVMAQVVQYLKWRYVWAVGDEGSYGYNGVKSFSEAIQSSIIIFFYLSVFMSINFC